MATCNVLVNKPSQMGTIGSMFPGFVVPWFLKAGQRVPYKMGKMKPGWQETNCRAAKRHGQRDGLISSDQETKGY